MEPKYFALNQKIGTLIRVPADQGRIVALAVAMATAAHARLPSSPVENIPAFYADQVYPVAVDKLSDINESIIFGAKQALEYTQTFWKMRYFAAFPCHYVDQVGYRFEHLIKSSAKRNFDLTTVWAGGATEISEELSFFMNKYSTEIAVIAAQICNLMTPRETDAPESL